MKKTVSSANDIIKENEATMDQMFSNDDFEQEPKGSFVGTEDYVAPEIIQNEECSFASDLWSLGVIIYQIFTGKTPFKG